jgi:hypothetical protein
MVSERGSEDGVRISPGRRVRTSSAFTAARHHEPEGLSDGHHVCFKPKSMLAVTNLLQNEPDIGIHEISMRQSEHFAQSKSSVVSIDSVHQIQAKHRHSRDFSATKGALCTIRIEWRVD